VEDEAEPAATEDVVCSRCKFHLGQCQRSGRVVLEDFEKVKKYSEDEAVLQKMKDVAEEELKKRDMADVEKKKAATAKVKESWQ